MAKIVVGVDGSSCSDVALSWARREAAARGWALVAVLAWDYLNQPGPIGGAPFDVGYGEESARQALTSYVARAPQDDGIPRDAIEEQLVCDLPGSGLLAAAADADLLVVGARGRGALRRLALGSVSEHVLDRHPGDVVVIHDVAAGEAGRPGAAARGRIVVGTDGSEGSAAAVRWALDEARAHGSTVEIVHAWEASLLGGGFPVTAAVHPRSWYEHAAREVLDKALVGIDVSGVPAVERQAVEGPAVPTILAHAHDADLLVVSSRGLGGLRSVLAGSVSRSLVHKAGIPVAVVKRVGH